MLQQSYLALPDTLFDLCSPVPVSNPQCLLWNHALARELGLPESWYEQASLYFSGNQLIPGSRTAAFAYSGHQFGHFNPYLGDGRAHWLGEWQAEGSRTVDIQLKGSGRTAYSRQGDGRCALGPAVREFIMSESMAALGVPTTRCLAVVKYDDTVWRHRAEPAAIVTRIAQSHIRVGTFQYLAARQDHDALRSLLDYAIARHYPQLNTEQDCLALAFLEAVCQRQIDLVIHWLRVGFIHGVMNTDNCAISGETIDYGPCAMLGTYQPDQVFSSIDQHGRYAFSQQPTMVKWNMTRLAEALLPLMGDDEEWAIEQATEVLQLCDQLFEEKYPRMLAAKIGLTDYSIEDNIFIQLLLKLMQQNRLDYTLTFSQLADWLADRLSLQELPLPLHSWATQWRKRIASESDTLALMQRTNPRVIARNHLMERVLKQTETSGIATDAETFLAVLRKPYVAHQGDYEKPDAEFELSYRTFCGT